MDKPVKESELNKYLVCSLCDGYYRFAHSVSECGHTFCKICIFNYANKQNGKRCPQCFEDLGSDLKKSIK